MSRTHLKLLVSSDTHRFGRGLERYDFPDGTSYLQMPLLSEPEPYVVITDGEGETIAKPLPPPYRYSELLGIVLHRAINQDPVL